MQSYIDNGYRNINALSQYCQESFSASSVHNLQSQISRIKTFYDNISLHLDPAIETAALSSWYKMRILLLVRRISRTLTHLVIQSKRKNKCLKDLTILLVDVCSECDIVNVIEQDLTNNRLQELRQFEVELQYEKELYEREISRRIVDTTTDLNILTLYLTRCIDDNSSLYVTGLVDDIDEFLKNHGISADTQNRGSLKQRLNKLQIPLDFFLLEFQYDTRSSIEREQLRQELGLDRNVYSYTDNHILHGLATKDVLLRKKSKTRCITDILKCDRYIVLLGDPGSGKSTFMRFVTRNLAVDLLNSIQASGSERALYIRIPILIHLALFAKECAENESLSILEYIKNRKNALIPGAGEMLKNEIINGNCILLFDGLDEVFTFESRHRVVRYVQNFIEQFALSPAFISPFDSFYSSIERSLDGELACETNGNQVIMTSRFVGYDATSLLGNRISHYIVPNLGKEEQLKFIHHWHSHVHESINKIFLSHDVSALTETCYPWTAYADELVHSIEKDADLCVMTSNPILLSMICACQYYSKDKSLPSLRIHLYQESVAFTLRGRYLPNKGNISEDMMHWILEDVAAYMHNEEPSGVIDRFVLKRVCVHSIKAFYATRKDPYIRKIPNVELTADEFIRLIDQDAGLLIARGQQIYGFIQMTFQEYFTSLRLVRSDVDEENVQDAVKMLLAYIKRPRFLFPVLLALEWLSCNWATENFNTLCQQLVSYDANSQNIPVGSILLIKTSKSLSKKPDKSVFYDAFDKFVHAHSNDEWFSQYPSLGEEFCVCLNTLPTVQSIQWLLLYLRKAASYEIVDLCCLIHRHVMNASQFPEWLDADVCMFLSTSIQYDIDNNVYAVEQLLCLVAERKCENLWKIRTNSRGLQTLMKSIAMNQNQHHPLILAVIIALHGGLHGNEFNCLYIYRESVLSIFIAEYYDQITLSHASKVNILLKRCEVMIHENGNINNSLSVLDAFTTLLCVKGIHDHNLCEKYKFNPGFYTAVQRLKNVFLYLRKQCGNTFLDYPIDNKYLATNSADNNCTYKDILESIQQYMTKEENASSIFAEAKMLASEYMLAFMDAIAVSLASLTLSIEHVQSEMYESFSLFKWRMSPNIWTDNIRYFITNHDLPYSMVRTIPDWISFLSMIIHSDDYVCINYKDKKYVHKQFMQSVFDHTHIFYYTKDHPLFLVSFIRPHRRALFCRLITTNSLNTGGNSSDDWLNQMARAYLLVECFDDFPRKYDNNVCVFAFLILLLETTLKVNKLQYFALAYFLKAESQQTANLKNFLRDISSLFPWAQTIESFDKKSVVRVVEEQRQYLSKTLLDDSGPQRDFELYTICVSLAHLSSVQSDDMNVLRDSLLKEVQCGALNIGTPFYKTHALSFCINLNSAEFLESLPSPSYFLMTEKFSQDDKYFDDVIKRLNCLFHDLNKIEDQEAVCEALLPIKCFRRYIHDMIEKRLLKNDILMLNRALQIKSPVLHFHLENIDNLWSDKPSNSLITFHVCLYLASLIIEAQNILNEFEEQPIASLNDSNIIRKLKPSGYPHSLSKSQAHAITQYLENAFQLSKVHLIQTALHVIDDVETTAYPYIRQWLQYREVPDLKLFAWHASILLPIESTVQVSILIDIFQSENADFLTKVRNKTFTVSVSPNPSLLSDMIERMLQTFRCKTSPIPFPFLKRLIIDRVELVLQLFQAEQRLICENLECDRIEHDLYACRDEQKIIWEKLETAPTILGQFVLDVSKISIAQTFITEINSVLDKTNIGLLSTTVDQCLYLHSLQESFEPIREYQSQTLYASNEYVSMKKCCRTFFWEMILSSNQDTVRSRLVLYKCIRFYCKDFLLLTDSSLKVIEKIAAETSGSELHEILMIVIENQAIRTAYLNDESTKDYCNKLDELLDTHAIQYDQPNKVRQIAEYINKHHTTLLPIFVKDFIRSLDIASKGYDELSQPSIYGEIADHLCELSTRNFHAAIREVPQREQHFKELLFKIKSYEHLAYYGELTPQFLELIFEESFDVNNNDTIEEQIIPRIISIASRPVLKQLYQKLTSTYFHGRLLAAKLLVQLALCDAVSAHEVSHKIAIAIQDPAIQQQMKWFHADNKDCSGHNGLTQEMRQMLLQLSFADYKSPVDSAQLCHESTFILHYAKQIRNQVVCLFNTNQLFYVDESGNDSINSHSSNSDDDDIREDNISS